MDYSLFIPPLINRNHTDNKEYIDSAFYIINLIKKHIDINPFFKIADIGCAAGRLAIPFLAILTTGEYIGLDIRADSVYWANKNISSRYPRFKFKHVNFYNEFFNTEGKDPLVLPIASNHYNLIIFHSVFTHISFSDAQQFLSEIQRVLQPGGIAHITAFLWDENARIQMKNKNCSHDFSEQKNKHVVCYKTKISAMNDIDLFDEIAKNNLSIILIEYGQWRDVKTLSNAQDRIILQKQ